jgi:hypothetical protein
MLIYPQADFALSQEHFKAALEDVVKEKSCLQKNDIKAPKNSHNGGDSEGGVGNGSETPNEGNDIDVPTLQEVFSRLLGAKVG